jgi:haloalkane dehalogenase
MSVDELQRADGIAYREAMPASGTPESTVLCVHGFPETSYMWRHLVPALAEAGHRALAPDLLGFGDNPPDPPATWERQVEHLERFRRALDLPPVVLVVHDWGGLIALRWACDNPGSVAAMVLSNTGFFADGKWNAMAETFRTEGQGEQLVANLTREAFGALLADMAEGLDDAAIDEYWKTFATEEGRQSPLDLYRSGDFEKLEPYQGRLAELDVPTLILWGEKDTFAPVGGAHRFHKQLPGSELVLVDVGHFVYEDAPERCAEEIVSFLDEADNRSG